MKSNSDCVVTDLQESAQSSHMILSTGLGRWLNVAEIEVLLNPSTTILSLSTSPPSNPPPSGTLLLYNRSVTRNYKDDGYKWIKKRNSQKVREDHVKLRVGGKFRVSGCYVHGAETLTLHRRAYHLLNPETGTALYPVSSSNSRSNMPSLVLVHYLDTKIASQHTANLMNQQNVNSNLPKTINSNNNVNITPHYNTNSPPPLSFNRNTNSGIPTQIYPDTHIRQTSVSSYNTSQDLSGICPSPDPHTHFSSSALGLETLDFLWDVIFTEGEDKLEQTLANGNFSVDPSLIKEMLDAKEGGQEPPSIETVDSYDGNKQDAAQVSSTEKESDGSGNPPNAPGLEMAAIVDVTPNQALEYQDTKIVISCSDPISNPVFENQNSTFAWHTLAAFVAVSKDNDTGLPKASEVDLFPTIRLNPYTCKSNLPLTALGEDRHVIIVSVFLDSGMDPYCKGIAASIGLVLEQSWNEQITAGRDSSKSWLHVSSHSQTVVKDRPFIRLLTQMSEDTFTFVSQPKQEIKVEEVLGLESTSCRNDRKESIHELPAPPPHMALVATALSDFPNPPVTAVLPPNTTMIFTGPNDIEQNKPLSEITDESPETKRIIQASMEATVEDSENNSKKRPNTSIEVGPSAVDNVPVFASAWASKPSTVRQSDTKAEEVDRHCKIRFVERLNDVIAETDSNTAVSDAKFKNMDDQELDDILDDLLVRIVESLVEISASSCEIQDELNVPDKSGFALLHYAAFYNLPSLIPVLLSRGANCDIQTSRGNLTPLHLACGAGNSAIVELLVSNGCGLNVPDCFGSFPVDHAMRNGFTSVAEFLKTQIMKDRALRSTSTESSHHNEKDYVPKNLLTMSDLDGYEQEKFLVQSAFSNLSLKDKLIFNMMVRKRKTYTNKDNPPTIPEGESDEESESDGADTNGDVEMENNGTNTFNQKCLKKVSKQIRREAQKDTNEAWEGDSVDSVITDSNKESLDIAMKLMNPEELEDIQTKSANDNVDLREWMLKRNYEYLMEASQHLQKTMSKHGENQSRSDIAKQVGSNAATVRSLKNIKSQALAGLVIRKNVIKRKNTGVKIPVEKNDIEMEDR